MPSVDAGLLVVERRAPALVAPAQRGAYVAVLHRAFNRGSEPVRRGLRERMPPMTWKRLARERGLDVDARPADLDVWDWVAVFAAVQRVTSDQAARLRR
jgi:16S rRNA A1518/A1519 N6-dimethyltransferase RsmA/KsgA/DIM1 with predicted DNA glycosylase/AP lyase activity